jgi:ferric-dicitrate binding protein FerR (iron transport regulator)
MNRYNLVQFEVADPSISDTPISGPFRSTEPEAFVAALSSIFKIRAVRSRAADSGERIYLHAER